MKTIVVSDEKNSKGFRYKTECPFYCESRELCQSGLEVDKEDMLNKSNYYCVGRQHGLCPLNKHGSVVVKRKV